MWSGNVGGSSAMLGRCGVSCETVGTVGADSSDSWSWGGRFSRGRCGVSCETVGTGIRSRGWSWEHRPSSHALFHALCVGIERAGRGTLFDEFWCSEMLQLYNVVAD